ncbi:MAG TPA: alpha/beta fold hydrolase [Candidatus Acidoferrales bacterium]|jgi:polyhydroxyalkanoate synthase|nr:alpha/beta fold hydrolase [Candidatus Acidoferrales bacterium]
MIDSIAPEELGYGIDMAGVDPASLNDALKAVMTDAMMDPMRIGTWMTSLMLAEQNAGMNMLRRLGGMEPLTEASPLSGDKRFSDPEWSENPLLAGMIEDYRIRSDAALQLVETSRLPESTKRKARFAVQLMNDALAPSNVPWINPGVVREAMDTKGQSLVAGLQNFLDDVKNNNGYPRQVDTSGFVVGKNIGATPGRVVMRNDLIELIAYEPQTPKVHAVPLLMCPPWINKYYIMDLAPGRSFVEWAVQHGHQVFMISYRNPDASMSHYTMDDYLRKGILAAIDAVQDITGAPKVDLAALCLGGTLALIAMAYLAAHGEGDRVNSCTLTNTLIDFSIPGDLGVFTDEDTISKLEKKMQEKGYLESSEMAKTFDWMRANDLIWSYVVSNWFKGKQPPAFDILSWNADSTRMPVAMHSQYLRTCYLHNSIVKPNAFTIDGTPIDLGKIQTPIYVLGAEGDHIAPWHATYRTTQLTGGDTKYTLTNAGHIAGIVNPPGGKKTAYWTKPHATKGESPSQWRESSTKTAESWWEDWARWSEPRGGEMVAPYALPEGEAAPGRYVNNETAEPFAPKPVAKKEAAKAAVTVPAKNGNGNGSAKSGSGSAKGGGRR